MNVMIAIVAFAIVGVVVAILLAVLFPPAVIHCPRCGGDLVRWSVTAVSNGFDQTIEYRGCPKVRDKGAGSPGEKWADHFCEVARIRSTSRFDPYG